MSAQATSHPYNNCINNQRYIVGALEQYALEKKTPQGAMVEVTNLVAYLKGGSIPACPLGGLYPTVLTNGTNLGAESSFCSLGGLDGHNREIKRLESPSAFWPVVGVVAILALVSGGLAFFFSRLIKGGRNS